MGTRRAEFFLAILFVLAVHGCGGGGGGASTPVAAAPQPVVTPPPDPSGTLAPGVRVLSASEIAGIVSQDERSITFAGAVDLPEGSIVLTDRLALKIGARSSASGRTVFQASTPVIEEVFRQLEFNGALRGATLDTPAIGTMDAGYLTFPLDFDAGGRISGSMSTGVLAGIEYRLGANGVEEAALVVEADSSLTLNAAFDRTPNPQSAVQAEQTVGTLRMVLPLALTDSAGNAAGTRPATLLVPVVVGVEAISSFALSLNATVQSNGTSLLELRPGRGIEVTPEYSGDFTTTLAPVVPAGAVPGTSFGASLSVYTRSRAAASFMGIPLIVMNTWVEVARWDPQLQVLAAAPGYCLRTTQRGSAIVDGFVPGPGRLQHTALEVSRRSNEGSAIALGSCT